MGLVDTVYRRAVFQHLDFTQGAGILRQAPVGGQWLVESLQEEGTVTTAVPYHHDGLFPVQFAHQAQNVRDACQQVLQ